MARAVPGYTDGNGYFDVTPQDYYTIYNLNPLFTAGTKGAGSTIAVIEESDIEYGTVNSSTHVATGGDVATFRSLFGVPGTLNMLVYHGYGTTTCSDPGIDPSGNGEDEEASLDAEWATAAAPSATLVFMSCDNVEDDGIFTSMTALIDNSYSDSMSLSYGETERLYTDFSFLDTLYAQAAMQGQSVFISTGDSGSDVEDQNTTGTAVSGINVSAFSASPNVTASGGTDFSDYYDALENGPAQSTYWSSSNSSTYGNAISYVPETAWNDSCASSILAAAEGDTGAGLCATGDYAAGDVVGGSGGISTHYSQPSYQTGITGLSSSITMRVQPDFAAFAGNGFWYHGLIFCDSHYSEYACDNTADFGLAGGTSFVAPQMAGVGGLLVDYTGSRQGLLNYGLYSLAKTQFTASATKTACYSNGQTANSGVTTGLPASTCIFHDVTTSNNSEPCESGSLDCYVNSGKAYGMLSTTGATSLTVAYPSGIGYDEVSGIGTPNIYNLVTKWNTAFSTSTALSASSTSITTSQSTTLTAKVTATVPNGSVYAAVTGKATFYSGTTSIGSCTLSSAACDISVTGSTLGTGSHSITAVYSGSNNYPTSTSTAVSVTVTSSTATTTTTASASPSSISYGSSTTLKATVTASSGTATGTITFTYSSTTLGTCTLSSGSCTLATTALPVGSDLVTASYPGVNGQFGSSSGTVTVTVTTATTTTAVTATPNSIAYGASTTLKATVTSSGGTPTGTITFKYSTTTLGTCTLSSGTCSLATTALPVGSDSVTASYGGATDFATSSGSATVTVTTAATTTAVTATPNSIAYGASTTLKATVTSSGGTPTGTITFKYSTTTLGTCTLSSGTCSLATTALPVGSDSVTASYGGATDFATSSGSATVTVTTAATTTAVTATPNSIAYGASTTLKATVTSSAGTPTGTITFKYSTTTLGTCTLSSGTCSLATTALPVGSDSVTASYGGATDFATSSGSATVTVNAATTTTVLTVTPNPVAVGANVTLKATVTASVGTATGGTVTFVANGDTLIACTLENGSCSVANVNTNGFAAGTYSGTAVYGGTTDFSGSTSPAVPVTLSKSATTTTVAVSPTTVTPPATVTATATVARPGGSQGTPTGTVSFYADGILLGTSTVGTNGKATFSDPTTGVTAGSYTISATYSGDSNDNTSSGSTSVTVN
jgi:hypothetical protein